MPVTSVPTRDATVSGSKPGFTYATIAFARSRGVRVALHRVGQVVLVELLRVAHRHERLVVRRGQRLVHDPDDLELLVAQLDRVADPALNFFTRSAPSTTLPRSVSPYLAAGRVASP